MALVVWGATTYGTDDGHLHVFGEVVNSTAGSISDVKVVGTFYGTDNQVVDTGDTYAMLDIVGAGESAPFDLVLEDPPSTIETYDLQVEYAITSSSPLRLALVSAQGSTADDGDYHILGEVQNQHSFTVTSVRVVATVYNAEYDVIGAVVFHTALGTLTTGQKTSFDVELLDPSEDVADYTLVIEADRR
jgi:hypothetical protein